MTMTISSTAFADGAAIPARYTAEGKDVSPPLAWSGLPEGTVELAIVCDDPDAPRPEPWVHWVIYNVPASATGLDEGVPPSEKLASPPGAMQGKNTWPATGYRGPAPPPGHGTHHYHFKLYALDQDLPLAPGLTKDQLLAAMKGHVLDEAELIGTYER